MHNQHPVLLPIFAVVNAAASWTLADINHLVSIAAGLLACIAALFTIVPKALHWGGKLLRWARGLPPALLVMVLSLAALAGCDTPGMVVHRTFYPTGELATETKAYQSPNAKGPGKLRVEPLPVGGVVADASTGDNYNFESIRQAFAAFRPWHAAALACIVVGVVIVATGYLPKRWGVTLLVAGFSLGGAAHVIPAYGGYFTALAGLGALAGAFYIAWQSGYFTPNPALTDEQRRAAAQRLAFP